MIKAIIFDIDDTLTQTIRVKWNALKETGKRIYDLKITDRELTKYWGLPFTDLIAGLFKSVDATANIVDNYYKVVNEYPAVAHVSAIKLLNDLSGKYILCALTSSTRKLIEKDFRESGIDPELFFVIQTQEDTKTHKPDPKVLAPILKKLSGDNILIDQTVSVGDSLKDYQCARKAGLKFIAVTTGLNSRHDFLSMGFPGTLIIDDLMQLTGIIEKIN